MGLTGRREFLKTASMLALGTGVAPYLLHGESTVDELLPAEDTLTAPIETFVNWPRRPLMQEQFENSMEARFLAKPVHEFLIVDDMEQERGWTAAQTVQLEYTTERCREGTRSLRFRTSQWGPEYDRATGRLGGGIFDDAPPLAPSIHLKFDRPQDWSRFNRISIWCYVHPTAVPYHSLRFQFYCQDAPTGPSDPYPIHFIGELRRGEWNLLTWEIPDFKRDKITEIAILRPVWGYSRESERGEIVYDFDQLRVERVDVKPYEGWQPAADTIAFNHVGYLASLPKVAILGGTGAGAFQLINNANGSVVGNFPIQEVSNRRGKFRVLDFSSYCVPGRYRLQCDHIGSRSFAISEDVWDHTIEKTLNYFYGSRCGFDVPGHHDACHQDVMGSHGGVTKCVNGGWHDAGNMSQNASRTELCAYAMLSLFDRLKERGIKPDLQARVLEEARWGLEWSLRSRFGSGWRVAMVRATYFSDNKIGTADDLTLPAVEIPFENFIGAATAAYAARIFKPIAPKFAAELLDAAIGDFQSAIKGRKEPPEQNRPARIHAGCWRDEVAYGTLAAVHLYKATQKVEFATEALRLGRLLLEMQEQRFIDGIPITGYFYEDSKRVRIVHDTHSSFEEAPIFALRELCDAFPDHPDWMQWYAAVLLNSEFFLRRGSRITGPYNMAPAAVWRRHEIEEWAALKAQGLGSSFGRLPDWLAHFQPSEPKEFESACMRMFDAGTHLSADFRLRAFPLLNDKLGHGNANLQLAMTSGLGAAAELRSAPGVAKLANEQLLWLFGGNPFSQTLMFGEGYDYQKLVAEAVPDLVGAMPLGIESRHDDAPVWTHTTIWAPKDFWVLTTGRTILAFAHAAIPARVTGSAGVCAAFREKLTGKLTKVEKGSFAINLAPGHYTITYGSQLKELSVVPGGQYSQSLDPKTAMEVQLLGGDPIGQSVPVEVKLFGEGSHRIELRTFNCSVKEPKLVVRLKSGKPQTLRLDLRVQDKEKPWIVVAIPDGELSQKRELYGTVTRIDESVLV